MEDSLISRVILRYHPDWEPPKDNGREWISCLCPFHEDSRKSASVSYRHDAYKCFSCPAGGDAIGIIMREGSSSYPSALKIAEGLSSGSNTPVRRGTARKPRRRNFGEQGSVSGGSDAVQARFRRRPPSWT